MPLREGTTVEDCVQVIVEVALHPRKMRSITGEQTASERDYELALNNAGVFMLKSLGYNIDEIRELYRKELG